MAPASAGAWHIAASAAVFRNMKPAKLRLCRNEWFLETGTMAAKKQKQSNAKAQETSPHS